MDADKQHMILPASGRLGERTFLISNYLPEKHIQLFLKLKEKPGGIHTARPHRVFVIQLIEDFM